MSKFTSLQFEVLEDRQMLSSSGLIPNLPLPLPALPLVTSLENSLVSTLGAISQNPITTPLGNISVPNPGTGTGGILPTLPGSPLPTAPGNPQVPSGPFASSPSPIGAQPETGAGGQGSSTLTNTVSPTGATSQPVINGVSVMLFLESAPFTLPPNEVHPTSLNTTTNLFGATTGGGASEALITPTGSAPLFPSASNGERELNNEPNTDQQNVAPQSPNGSPETSGLLSETAPLALGQMERALQQFLDQLVDVGASVEGWIEGRGALPWLLMSVAVAVTLHEVVRQRLLKAQEQKVQVDQRDRWLSRPQGPEELS